MQSVAWAGVCNPTVGGWYARGDTLSTGTTPWLPAVNRMQPPSGGCDAASCEAVDLPVAPTEGGKTIRRLWLGNPED